MLISIVLTFTTSKRNTLPAALGRAVYAEVLRQIGQRDTTLAETLHAWNGPVPLTCSSLLGARRIRSEIEIGPGQPYEVRITGLIEPVSRMLESFLLDRPQETWTIHNHDFDLQQATCDAGGHPWAGLATYEALAAAHLLQPERLDNKVTFDFASPTGFKSHDMQVPLPTPDLVFGSLVDRWNQFSPVPLSEEMRAFSASCVAISHYELKSVAVRHKRGFHLGGVGRATYTALGGDRYWHAAMQMLADFALYSGVGVQTTNGMGQVRRLR